MENVAGVALVVKTPAGPRHALLSADAASDHAFLAVRVHRVSAAPARGCARLKRVEGAGGVQVAAPHLQLHFAQSGRVSAIGALKNNASEAQVLANERGALSRIQRSVDAITQRGRDAWSTSVNHKSGHISLCGAEENEE